jgi:hypothetical protein
MIGFSSRNVTRWRSNGGNIPWESADKAACKLGLHPSLVWGDEWWNVKGDFAQIAAEAWSDMEHDDFIDAEIDDYVDGEVDEFMRGEMVFVTVPLESLADTI